jgi:hypothetical protein
MGYSIRTEKWRYTEWDKGQRGVELYDEASDPDESNNLAGDPKHQRVVADMQRQLRRMTGQAPAARERRDPSTGSGSSRAKSRGESSSAAARVSGGPRER